jgi:hypothetical protein
MKTNAAVIATAAAELKRRADAALTKSVASIIEAGGPDRDAAIAESIGQYREYLQKGGFADVLEGDGADADEPPPA